MAGVTKGTEMTKKPGRCGVSLQKQGDGFPLLLLKNACFQLDKLEFENWKSQFATSSSNKMGLRKAPFAFTGQEQSRQVPLNIYVPIVKERDCNFADEIFVHKIFGKKHVFAVRELNYPFILYFPLPCPVTGSTISRDSSFLISDVAAVGLQPVSSITLEAPKTSPPTP